MSTDNHERCLNGERGLFLLKRTHELWDLENNRTMRVFERGSLIGQSDGASPKSVIPGIEACSSVQPMRRTLSKMLNCMHARRDSKRAKVPSDQRVLGGQRTK